MRKGWKTSTLGDTCEMYQPKTISAKEMVEDGPYPVYGANGVIGRYNQFNHEKPQLLITCRGATCGSVNISAPRSWVTGNAMVVRPKNGSLEMRYLEYLFRGGIDISRAITGAAQPQITRTNLDPLEISYPVSVDEQRRIVGILDEAFEGITTTKANAEKNVQNARDLFESHLQSVFSQRGKGWVEKKLEEVCAITSTLVDPRKKEFLDLTHVGAGNIEANTGILVDLKTAREEGLISGKFLFDESMVLYSKIRPYLKKVARPDFHGLCSADMYPLAPIKNEITRDYLFHFLLSKQFTDYAIQGSARSGMPKVNREHLFDCTLWLPELATQKQLAAKLDGLHEETQRLANIYERKLAALAALKQSLLHQAFTGQLTMAA
jgi:type I restriction enzyme S subunit